MFDGHFRANAERTLKPVGQQLNSAGAGAVHQAAAVGVQQHQAHGQAHGQPEAHGCDVHHATPASASRA